MHDMSVGSGPICGQGLLHDKFLYKDVAGRASI